MRSSKRPIFAMSPTWWFGLILAGLMAAVPAADPAFGQEAADAPYFVDVAAEAGVAVVHHTRSFDNPYAHIMEGYTALGASAAVADVDGDGLEDIFVTDSSVGGRNLLWHNVTKPGGGLRFVDVAASAGVAEGNDAVNASANSLFFDLEGDGDPDLLVVRFGQNLLFENMSQGDEIRFREVTSGSGLDGHRLNCIAALAFDMDRDGDLDLLYANYFAPVDLFHPETPRFFPESFETATNGGGVTLWRNEGPEHGRVRFTDVTEAAGMGDFSGWALDLGHADVDRDGDDDVFVAADFGADRLYRNDGGGVFTDVTPDALGIDTKKGMNADWGDFNGDGTFDLFVTNITDEYMQEGNFLWQNLTKPGGEFTFTDVARETGTHNTGWGWAGKFFDYDNDGRLDLYTVNGWVSGSKDNYVLDIFQLITQPDVDLSDARLWPPIGEKTLSGYQHNALFHNEDGYFVDEGARHGVDSLLDGRGVAVADFDRDGRLDLFVTNAGAAPFLFRNVMPRDASGSPHWLQLELTGTGSAGSVFNRRASNRDGIGARVRVSVPSTDGNGRELWSFVNGGNGFASQSSRTLHFGLGTFGGPVAVRVHWPSGRVEDFADVAVDRLHEFVEGEAPARNLETQLFTHRNLGKAFYENSATQQQAVDEFQKALEVAPDSARERVNYGLALMRAGREDEGIAQLEQAQQQDPSIPHTWFNLGIAYKRDGRYDEARRQLEGMKQRAPGDAVTRYNLGLLYKLAKMPEPAIAEFRRASELDPNLAGPYFQLATSLRQAGRTDESEDAMSRFRELKRRAAGSAVEEDLEWSWYSEIYEILEPVKQAWDPPPRHEIPPAIRGLSPEPLRDAAQGDFDNDGDLDAVLVGETVARLWRNEAQGESESESESKSERLNESEADFIATEVIWPGDFQVAVWLDYDHDYDLDLFLLGREQRLLRNQGAKGWVDRTADFPFRAGAATAAVRFDVMADSQGVDLAVTYEGAPGVLYRDRLGGRYEAEDLPGLPPGTRRLVAADLDRDGWTDLFAATDDATGIALRNDAEGGFEPKQVSGLDDATPDLGPELRIELRGVKNLKAAQGSEIEVKAGTYYRKKLYDGQPLAFALPAGTERVDTVRITWPNGLIQNETLQEPGHQVYEEAQRLSGSCPMIFTWNGEEFEFITDVLGVAPLGAAAGDGPVGREYFPVDHDEVIQIAGEQLIPRVDESGRRYYDLRITEELREVAFLDHIRLVAVDHAATEDIFVNSKFQGPPFPEARLFGVAQTELEGPARRWLPHRAVDSAGNDVLDRVLHRDRTYPDGFHRAFDGSAELHWLELDFGVAEDGVAGDGEAILVLSGWVDWADGSTFLGASQASELGLVMPYLQVRDAEGRWVTALDDMGMPAGKPKTIVVDLTGRFLSSDRSVRIVGNLALYWDQIFLGESAAPPRVIQTEVPMASAELRFRGFSRPVVHPERRQAEHFIYGDVQPVTMWNPTPGLYTRYGEVESLLRRVDDRLVILGSGDEVRLRFDAESLPALDPASGLQRDFLLIVDGWAKDADANTAHSQTVGPLPFHGMPRYPYEGLASYPDDPQLRLWREHYNTRVALRLIRPLSPLAPPQKRTRAP